MLLQIKKFVVILSVFSDYKVKYIYHNMQTFLHNNMNINKNILQYAKSKDISQRKFTASLGLAEGVLRRGKNIGSGYLTRIRKKYPDLNMNWVLFDEGEMILDSNYIVTEPSASYGKVDSLQKELEFTKALLHSKDEIMHSKNETILLLKEQLEMYQSKKNTG